MNREEARKTFGGLLRLGAAMLMLSAMGLVPLAFAQNFTGLVIFGTSLSDPGNHFVEFGTTTQQPFAPVPNDSYAIGGHHFTNGATWVEQVARGLHMPTSGSPAFRSPGVFTNYAFGRARARTCVAVTAACPSGPFEPRVVDLTFEVSHFLADFGTHVPTADLYVMEIGINDVSDALTALQFDSSGATSVAIITAAVNAEANNLLALYGAGARTFLITSAPDLGLTPFVRSLGPVAILYAGLFAQGYNAGMATVLAGMAPLPGIRFITYDLSATLADIESRPGDFGITDAVAPCLAFGVVGHAICAQPNKHLFWDGSHPTETGHGLVAADVLKQLAK